MLSLNSGKKKNRDRSSSEFRTHNIWFLFVAFNAKLYINHKTFTAAHILSSSIRPKAGSLIGIFPLLTAWEWEIFLTAASQRQGSDLLHHDRTLYNSFGVLSTSLRLPYLILPLLLAPFPTEIRLTSFPCFRLSSHLSLPLLLSLASPPLTQPHHIPNKHKKHTHGFAYLPHLFSSMVSRHTSIQPVGD